ncbi:hypothetical protein SISNIDRAFT_494852 [Sistotremastrum niveocremeum HHB9708]|uniref:Uncharacterized protein n=1 Tax=Sistotremastrum niveocremeum HHB9708 TaxID=1314777 RepID=A0A164VNK9_9AGAM|nr:hypothetical protein SISNIDRAFT_494852 [Sistotremastrum niveocremeum HHB9708]
MFKILIPPRHELTCVSKFLVFPFDKECEDELLSNWTAKGGELAVRPYPPSRRGKRSDLPAIHNASRVAGPDRDVLQALWGEEKASRVSRNKVSKSLCSSTTLSVSLCWSPRTLRASEAPATTSLQARPRVAASAELDDLQNAQHRCFHLVFREALRASRWRESTAVKEALPTRPVQKTTHGNTPDVLDHAKLFQKCLFGARIDPRPPLSITSSSPAGSSLKRGQPPGYDTQQQVYCCGWAWASASIAGNIFICKRLHHPSAMIFCSASAVWSPIGCSNNRAWAIRKPITTDMSPTSHHPNLPGLLNLHVLTLQNQGRLKVLQEPKWWWITTRLPPTSFHTEHSVSALVELIFSTVSASTFRARRMLLHRPVPAGWFLASGARRP